MPVAIIANLLREPLCHSGLHYLSCFACLCLSMLYPLSQGIYVWHGGTWIFASTSNHSLTHSLVHIHTYPVLVAFISQPTITSIHTEAIQNVNESLFLSLAFQRRRCRRRRRHLYHSHTSPIVVLYPLTYFGMNMLQMEKKCKQVNPNNPSWIEDPQRSTEAHCIAFGISNLIQLAGMCLHIIFNGTYHSLFSMIIFILCSFLVFLPASSLSLSPALLCILYTFVVFVCCRALLCWRLTSERQ